MRIERTGSVAAPGDAQAAGRAPRSGSSDDRAAVQVSPRVGELGRASEKSQTDRAARIAELRAAISRGSYQVDRDTLAVRIAEEELARAGRT